MSECVVCGGTIIEKTVTVGRGMPHSHAGSGGAVYYDTYRTDGYYCQTCGLKYEMYPMPREHWPRPPVPPPPPGRKCMVKKEDEE